jgi:excisionase family DNA binding protein
MSVDSTPAIALLTIAEVADLMNVSVTTVRRLQHARRLPFIKVGGSVRFSKPDIVAYLHKHRVDSID